jgi:hypothetical protein
MNKNFMIGFLYQGHFYCANVHKFRHSLVEYHVTILTNKPKDGVPSTIVLRDEGEGPRQASPEPVPEALLRVIVSELEKHEAA